MLLKPALITALALAAQTALGQTIGQPLNAWQEGSVEIHFIHTGRGNCSFFILPDATTFLVDPGEQDPTDPRTLSARQTPLVPDYTKRPYEWIADYVRQYMPAGRPPELDHVLITHYHSDHYGHVYTGALFDSSGRYLKKATPASSRPTAKRCMYRCGVAVKWACSIRKPEK